LHINKLILIPTPIGNLEDITLRAIRILGEVDAILCEDTRQSGKLLKHLGIEKKLIAYHKDNEHTILPQIIQRIKMGEQFALVSDAGTPVISDPGFLIVRECLKNNIKVETLPGPTAFVPALVNSGFPSDEFVFMGFLPHKKGRHTMLLKIAAEHRTIILYESNHRLVKLLEEFKEYLTPDRRVSVSRELTKMFEENIQGTAEELHIHFSKKDVKGECVVVLDCVK
jgi:16S rRNA (cytidine1402-2'-O)-methyltransferase